MKILMFIDTIGRHGGAESQFTGLAKLLKSIGYDVEILTYYEDEGYLSEFEKHSIKVHIVNLGHNRLSKILNARKIIKSINPYLIISFKDGANIIASLLKFIGAKWILIVGERSTTQYKNYYTNIKFWAYKFADAIVPNSHSQREYINKHYPNLSSKVRVISNFTDTDKFHPTDSKHEVDDLLKIIVVARVSPEKNTIAFINAINMVLKNTSVKLTVDWYGYITNKEYYFKCCQEVQNLELSDVFRFHQPVENIDTIYPLYDVCCLPSLYEGFPNAICEGMACGLPILASNVCDNGLIVEDSINGFLFNPHSIESMTDAVNKIASINRADLQLMGESSRRLALQKFSSKTFVDKYQCLINKLSCYVI